MVDLTASWRLVVVTSLLCVLTSTVASQTEPKLVLEDAVKEGRHITGTPVMHYGGKNGTLCAANLTNTDAKVLCAAFGYSEDGTKVSSVAMASTEIRVLALSCSGNEENFYNCSGFSWGNYTSQCEGQQAARIKCTKKAGFNHGSWTWIFGLQGAFWGVFGYWRYKKYQKNKMCQKQCGKTAIAAEAGNVNTISGKQPEPATGANTGSVVLTGNVYSENIPPPPTYHTSVTGNTPPPPYSTNTLPPLDASANPAANTYSTKDDYRTQFS